MSDNGALQQIDQQVKSNRVVLFMKGTPQQPMCGFSARTVSILDGLVEDYVAVNVLDDERIREGIKQYGNWPTIPQLYVDGELVGGCDIIDAMFNTGELHQCLDLPPPDRTPPDITITDAAAGQIRAAMEGHDGLSLRLAVDASWQPRLTLQPAEGHEIVAESNGIRILTDPETAARARGATIDLAEGAQGPGLKIDLPEAPRAVQPMPPAELRSRLAAGDALVVVDTRRPEERDDSIPGAVGLDRENLAELEQRDAATPMVFVCAHGNSSKDVAEHFRRKGFVDLYNLEGGIEAWRNSVG